ncbi:SIMPL domain-containing protein [Colwellia sp. MEBiC06753]
MFKQLVIASVTTALVYVSATANAEGIRVMGKATINQTPDQFKLSVTVSERHKVAQKAKITVDAKTKQVIQVANKLGLNEQQIKSLQMTISPIYQQKRVNVGHAYLPANANKQSSVVKLPIAEQEDDEYTVEFEVRRVIDLQLNAIADYDQLLDQLTKIGVSRISPVQSSISNAEQLYNQALTQAIANAKNKAELLAKNLGVSLGKVLSLEEHGYQAPARMMMAAEADGSSAKLASYAGLESISAQVTVTFSVAGE